MIFAINSLQFIFLSLKLDNIVEWSWVVSALNLRDVQIQLPVLCSKSFKIADMGLTTDKKVQGKNIS